MNQRWVDYVMRQGPAFAELIAAEERKATPTLYIMGDGFDPRTITTLERILERRGAENLKILRLELPPAPAGTRSADLAEENRTRLANLATDRGFPVENLPWPEVVDQRTAGLQLIRALIEGDHLNDIRQVIVDISALPRGVYFPVLAGLLKLSDEGSYGGDIQAVVCDNPDLDDAIVEEGAEGATTLGGFQGSLDDARSQPDRPLVWTPVLGSGRPEQLDSLLQYLDPDEVCPVLPFPAANPRRCDDLLLEHRELLFSEEVAVGPRNFIYAAEANPFDLYRALGDLQSRYRTALSPLGEATVALSAHSSKLLSIGVLLAAYEHELPVVHVFPTRYFLDEAADLAELAQGDQLTSVWLSGEPYR